MGTAAINEDLIQRLAGIPGTVLVGESSTPDRISTWEFRVIREQDVTPDQCRIYGLAYSPEDADGLCTQIRKYITSERVANTLREGTSISALVAQIRIHAYAAMEAWARGDDAIADEIEQDPTAWAKYTP